MMPKRIQRKRTKGWRMSHRAVYVGRPTRWGNPFSWQDYDCRDANNTPLTKAMQRYHGTQMALRDFEGWLVLHDMHDEIQERLRGADLACWCPLDAPCHADVLLEIANAC